ncbi:hypothetical protein [Pseudonocardia sp.]|uniref:hypothetical protein n=1 Tax=Pseudonocardia sp. TaxID=60912 RepID=UPI0031FE3445
MSTTGSADSPETTTNPDDPTPNAPGAALQTGFFRPRPSPLPRRRAGADARAADATGGSEETSVTADAGEAAPTRADAAEAKDTAGPAEPHGAGPTEAKGTAAVGVAPEPDPSADTVIVGAPVRAGTPDHPATLPALAPATLPAAFAPLAPPPVAAEPPAYPEPQRSYPVKERKGWRRLFRRS